VEVVEDVHSLSRVDCPDELIAGRGRLRTRELKIDVDEVAVIVPGEMRLRLRRPLGSG
jgi:hypothetical protein